MQKSRRPASKFIAQVLSARVYIIYKNLTCNVISSRACVILYVNFNVMEDLLQNPGVVVVRAKPEGQRKTFKPNIRSLNRIPDELLNDPLLNKACESLPQNYNFEIHKTIWRIRTVAAKRVALQLPEGM